MRTGAMRRRITVQALTTVRQYGEAQETFADWASMWCEVIEGGVTEIQSADHIVAERTRIFKVRYRTGFTETMEIVYDSQRYRILGIKEIGVRDGLEITGVMIK